MFALVGVVESIMPVRSKNVDYPYYELVVTRTLGTKTTKNCFLAYRKEIAQKTETLLIGDRIEISFVIYGSDYQGRIENKFFVSDYTILKRKKVKNTA
jgi:hypothetical protein